MICPECKNNQKYSNGMICSNCNYQFIFDPKVDQTNDFRFSKVLKLVSTYDSVYFTFNQFYAELIKVSGFKLSSHFGTFVGLGIFGAFIGYIAFESIASVLFISIAAIAIGCLALWAKFQPLSRYDVERLFLRWGKKKQVPKNLIYEPTLNKPPPTPMDHDVYDYGVEAILIVNKDIYVDLFVLNDMHVDLKALVMSQTGYPDYLLAQTKGILKNNPETPLFVVHDASNSSEMIKEVKKTYDIHNHEIIDLGLFPEDFQQIKKLKKFEEVPNKPLDIFSKNELVSLLTVSVRDRIPIAASVAAVYPNNDISYGNFG